VALDLAQSSPELLSIIVPAHNERRAIRAVVDRHALQLLAGERLA
jgi:hypothetical protein